MKAVGIDASIRRAVIEEKSVSLSGIDRDTRPGEDRFPSRKRRIEIHDDRCDALAAAEITNVTFTVNEEEE